MRNNGDTTKGSDHGSHQRSGVNGGIRGSSGSIGRGGGGAVGRAVGGGGWSRNGGSGGVSKVWRGE